MDIGGGGFSGGAGGGLPGGGLPGGGLTGGGVSGGKVDLPQGITSDEKKAVIKIGDATLAPDTGLPAGAGGGGTTSGGTASPATRVLEAAVQGEYRYAMLGLILGVLAIVGGVVLGLNGVVGSTSWSAKIFGASTKLNDAAPGTLLFVIGLFMVFVTRAKVDIKRLSDKP